MNDLDRWIARQIGYPDVWDTMTYPSLASALWELVDTTGEIEMNNIERKEELEINVYNTQRRQLINDYRTKKITANTLDATERALSEAHLERLRKIRAGY